MDEQREQAQGMAYHEAGHLCAAEHLGFNTDGMILNPGPLAGKAAPSLDFKRRSQPSIRSGTICVAA
jgi:hypothetical protein